MALPGALTVGSDRLQHFSFLTLGRLDGEEAQVAVRRDRPDLVLMDVRMPRMDGIAATRKLIERDPALRILVVTTFDADQYVFEALGAGASGFILKDSSPEQLVVAVRLIAAGMHCWHRHVRAG